MLYFCARLRTIAIRVHMLTKFYSRKQLACASGVSRTTFYRRMLRIQVQLTQMGVKPYQQLLPPDIVEWICQNLKIDMSNLP